MQDTQFYIDPDKRIKGPGPNDDQYYLDGKYIKGPKNSGYFWLDGDEFFGPSGDTGFRLMGNKIYAPSDRSQGDLPWFN